MQRAGRVEGKANEPSDTSKVSALNFLAAQIVCDCIIVAWSPRLHPV